MSADSWRRMCTALAGEPLLELPPLPGRVIVAADAPLSDEELAGVESPTELALILGVSRQAAHQRLAKRRRATVIERKS